MNGELFSVSARDRAAPMVSVIAGAVVAEVRS